MKNYKTGWLILSLFISLLGFGLLADNYKNAEVQKTTEIVVVSHNLGAAQPYEDHIYKASKKYNIEPELIAAVMFTESCGSYANDTCAWVNPYAYSPTMDKGLMQINYVHWGNLGSLIYDPAINIDLGSRLLKEALNARNGDYYTGLSAYNCGLYCNQIQHQYSQKTLRYYTQLKLKKRIYTILI